MGRAEAKTTGITHFQCTAYRKKFSCKPVTPMESVYFIGVPFGLSTQHMSTLQKGNPKPTKFCAAKIHIIHPT